MQKLRREIVGPLLSAVVGLTVLAGCERRQPVPDTTTTPPATTTATPSPAPVPDLPASAASPAWPASPASQ